MSAACGAYVALLPNHHDWDGLPGLLADDVKLPISPRIQFGVGPSAEGSQFSSPATPSFDGLWFAPSRWLEGGEVIGVFPKTRARSEAQLFIVVASSGVDGPESSFIHDYSCMCALIPPPPTQSLAASAPGPLHLPPAGNAPARTGSLATGLSVKSTCISAFEGLAVE